MIFPPRKRKRPSEQEEYFPNEQEEYFLQGSRRDLAERINISPRLVEKSCWTEEYFL
jgi:hypothetical protein